MTLAPAGAMSHDFKKLEVFQLADSLVLDVYSLTKAFPTDERYGLQAQLRRASVSVPSNIVEGASRASNAEYAQFLRVACGSASEAKYLLTLSRRLGYLSGDAAANLEDRFDRLVRSLEVLGRRVAAAAKDVKSLPATQR
jgi:four helix bundle protein